MESGAFAVGLLAGHVHVSVLSSRACGGIYGDLVIALLAAKAFGTLVVVSVWDPATYVLVCSVLAVAALASCFLPARHATIVEPMVALRED
jgi:ABC-type lipoprotein release transport system permease subunit